MIAVFLKVSTEIGRGCEDIWWVPAAMQVFKFLGDDNLHVMHI